MNDALLPMLIRASAGTGKTFRLSNRFLSLLIAGERPDRILATTFTRKAAGEIQQRVFQRLARAAVDSKEAARLGDYIGRSGLASEQALGSLAELVANQHRLQICTLDSFCIRVARCFSFEMGLLPGWTILDNARAKQIRQSALAEACGRADPPVFTELLRLTSRGAANRSVQIRLDQVVSNLYQLFLDSDRPAWEWLQPPAPLSASVLHEIREVLESLELPRTKKGTVNMRWESAHQNLIDCLDAENWEGLLANGLVKKVLERGNEPRFDRVQIPSTMLDVLNMLVEQITSDVLGDLSRQTRATYSLIEMFHSEYLKLKLAAGVLQFDDVKRFLACASIFDRLEDVYYRLDGRIRHVLLDEFQDTSIHEWQILIPIIEEVLAHADGEHSFFCVGDVKQAIYGWRGGVAAIFESLENHFEQINTDSMERSYRSSPVIMEFVNQIFCSLTANPALKEYPAAATQWAAGFKEHESALSTSGSPDFPGYARISYYQSFDQEHPGMSKTRQLATAIQELLSTGRPLEIGVLVRANKVIAEILYELSLLGIPASGEGGSVLLDSAAVTPILALLKLVDHPGDTVASFHVAHSPLTELLGEFRWNSPRQVDAVVARVQGWLLHRGLPYVIDTLREPLKKYCSERDLRRLAQLSELAHEFHGGSSLRLQDFLDFVSLCRIQDTVPAPVRVMTIHQAKGLEFDAVFLPELDQPLKGSLRPSALTFRNSQLASPSRVSIFPRLAVRALSSDLEDMHEQLLTEKIQEELCVLYVALTRAKQALFLFLEEQRDPEKFPATAAGVIRAALAQDCTDVQPPLCYELGNSNWHQKGDTTSQPKTTSLQPLTVPPFAKHVARKRGLPRKSPSGLEGGDVLSTAGIFRRLDDDAVNAADRGTTFHLLFEQVEWIEDFTVDNGQLVRLLHRRSVAGQEVELLIAEFATLLENDQIRQVLSRDYYTVTDRQFLAVERELPFAIRDGESMLTGIIDRVVFKIDQAGVQSAHILDFKTDRTENLGDTQAWLAEKQAFYAPQLKAYSSAIQSLYRISPEGISTSLIFASLGVVIDVHLEN